MSEPSNRNSNNAGKIVAVATFCFLGLQGIMPLVDFLDRKLGASSSSSRETELETGRSAESRNDEIIASEASQTSQTVAKEVSGEPETAKTETDQLSDIEVATSPIPDDDYQGDDAPLTLVQNEDIIADDWLVEKLPANEILEAIKTPELERRGVDLKLIWYARFERQESSPEWAFSFEPELSRVAVDHVLRHGPRSITVVSGCDIRESDKAVCSKRADYARSILKDVRSNGFAGDLVYDRYQNLRSPDPNENSMDFNRFAAIVMHD